MPTLPRMVFWVLRWLLIFLVSIVITLPFVVIATEILAVPVPAGSKDLGYGFIAFASFAMAAAGTFVVIWPIAVLFSKRVVNKYLKKASIDI